MKEAATPSKFNENKFSAGIVPVFRSADGEPLYLVLRCFNYWDFPKGGVHQNEDPLKAALRELKEETTITQASFTWGDAFKETSPYSKGKVARYYLAEVKSQEVDLPVNPFLGKPEHHEYQWLTYEKTRPLLGDRVLKILDWAHRLVSAG